MRSGQTPAVRQCLKSESSGSGRVPGVRQGPGGHSVPGAGLRSAPGAAGQGTGCREARDAPWSQDGAMSRAQVCVATGLSSLSHNGGSWPMGWSLDSGFWQRGDATPSPKVDSWGMVFGSRTG